MSDSIIDIISTNLLSNGICDVGFTHCNNPPNPALPYAISIVVHLSEAIVDEISLAPTHTYFHHYRTVNTFIDQTTLRIGNILEQHGYKYLPVAASQSICGYQGRYSHKEIAVSAGLGSIGRSNLFLHKVYGPRVRLGTVFTNCPLPKGQPIDNLCIGCDACVNSCPSKALTGHDFTGNTLDIFDPERCSTHMKKAYQLIGRGAVCGICMSVCPINRKQMR